MEQLNVEQVAELGGCSIATIKRKALAGELKAEITLDSRNRKKYIFNLTDLPEAMQNKYFRTHKPGGIALALTKSAENQKRLYTEYNDKDREHIKMWAEILEEWQKARFKYNGNKTDADKFFLDSLKLERGQYFQVSLPTLYRKWKAYKEGDLDGLLENRGGNGKGTTKMPEETWQWFLYAYLDERCLPVEQCVKMATAWTREYHPELAPDIPSTMTFRRRIAKELPNAVVTAGRSGEKAYFDRAAPYITRVYDELKPNDYWIADNHTLDIISQEDGKQHRLSLTAFIDARSGVMVGWNLTDNPCSASTVLALRKAILRFGIPHNVYFDNGSEFLTYDLAGRGHRTRKSSNLIDNPPGIFDRLGMKMTNAIVRNARAKPIERTFNTFKGSISRMFETFCGGNITERPEALKKTLKYGNIPTDESLREEIVNLIDGTYNAGEYGGAVKKDRGKRRIDVWNEYAESIRRPINNDELDLMLMRSSRPQKVGRNGVYITVSGMKLEYWDTETWRLLDKKVYVRYDPEHLETVRIYEAETDKYIRTVPVSEDTRILFNDTPEKVAIAQAKIRTVRKAIKDQLNEYRTNLPPSQRIDILDMQLRRAKIGLQDFEIKHPATIIPVRANEEPIQKAVGGEHTPVIVDIRKMNANAIKNKGKR